MDIPIRRVLAVSVFLLISCGFVFAAIPFILSMGPATHVKNDSILDIDISEITPGRYLQVRWQGAPVVIFRPNDNSLAFMESINDKVWGPTINKSNTQNVYVQASTYRGCRLSDTRGNEHFANRVPYGWYDPCHMGAWDYAGQAFKSINVPSGEKLSNLKVPHYKVLSEDVIRFVKL